MFFLERKIKKKGAKYAVEAMKYLKKYPDLKLKITGELTERDSEIKKLIEDNGLAERVEFVGFKRGSELAELISKCICLLCPAIWYENMPNTVLEAYAYGKPVIASDIGCFSEIVEDHGTGLLFEPKNPEDLADKVMEILSGNKVVEFGKNARKKVETEYTPEMHFSMLGKLFN